MVAELLARADLDAMPDDGRRHELVDGRYLEQARAAGAEALHVDRPFPVRLSAADLLN